jgi:hypothetical protein
MNSYLSRMKLVLSIAPFGFWTLDRHATKNLRVSVEVTKMSCRYHSHHC